MAREDMLEQVLKDVFTWHLMLHIAYFARVEERIFINKKFDSETIYRSSKGEGDQSILLTQSTGTKSQAFKRDSNGELHEISRFEFMKAHVCKGDVLVLAEVLIESLTDLMDIRIDLTPAFASKERVHPHLAEEVLDEINYFHQRKFS